MTWFVNLKIVFKVLTLIFFLCIVVVRIECRTHLHAAIGRVNEGSSAIAAAVEEQAAATQEIVSNMNTATQGVEQINGGIFSIKGGMDSTAAATKEVLDSARMLSSQAEKMDKEVKEFLHEILAA